MKAEVVVNANLEGIVLGRIRYVDGVVVSSDIPSIRLVGEKVGNLTKGDGLLLEANTLLQKGNYLYAPDCKIIDIHYSGKPFQIEESKKPEEQEDKAPF